MNNDRELLELAAKAIGRRITGWNQQHGVEVAVLDDGSFWQPLSENHITDCMGDALRLAHALRMNFESLNNMGGEHYGFAAQPRGRGDCGCVELGGEISSLRRAIVRAAAEIGRAMK